MSIDVVKYAFIAGELSNTLYGRTDLTKFDLGMSEARNFFVDYRGGLSTRPGTKFCEHLKADGQQIKLAFFSFNPDEEDTYVLILGDEYIRFTQSGAYVLEDAITVSDISSATPAVVTSTAHGLETGRWVVINGVTYSVTKLTDNTFSLYSVPAGEAVDGSELSLADAFPVYELASPYTAEQLDGLSFDQYRDQLRITSSDDLPIRSLVRNGHTDWELVLEEIGTFAVGPVITGESLSSAGDAETLFAVTSVYADGSESSIGPTYKVDNAVNYPITEGSVSITWAKDNLAVSYNVYRSVVSVNETLSFGMELGYAGNTKGTKFTDPNIIVDFGRTPPINYNPFAPGAVTSITIDNGGSGYTETTTVSVSGGGSGFAGRVIVNDAGQIVRVIVMSGGEGYSSPTVSFTGAGTGAAATATLRAASGTYPSLSAIYQQRQIYAASQLDPITLWGSQYKRFSNFNYSENVLDTDSFEFNLDTAAVAPIRHLVPTRGGLLAMTQENIWLISGGNQDKAITATNALADPQTYNGVSNLYPVRVGEDLLYVEGKGYAVRLLSYNELSRVYGGDDKSILSSHLFGRGKEIVAWAYQDSPYKVVWCVRADGVLLAFTIVKSEDVFAWTPCDTRGRFLDVITVKEGTEDIVYVIVERLLNGRWTKVFERFDLRLFDRAEDAWCVDCGLALEGTTPSGTITILREDDDYSAIISGGSFTGAEGKVLRAAGGIFTVSSVTSETEVELTVQSPPTSWVPQSGESRTFPIQSGSWTLDSKVTTLSGLDHLEGETVSILADGNVFPQQVVENGQVTLSNGVTRAIVGLPFECRARTLPLIVPDAGIEAKRKRVVAVDLRITRSRGLQVGDSYATTYELRDRTSEAWGAPIALQEGFRRQPIGTTWTEDAFTYFRLTDPVPATLLSIVQEMEVGDDPD